MPTKLVMLGDARTGLIRVSLHVHYISTESARTFFGGLSGGQTQEMMKQSSLVIDARFKVCCLFFAFVHAESKCVCVYVNA